MSGVRSLYNQTAAQPAATNPASAATIRTMATAPVYPFSWRAADAATGCAPYRHAIAGTANHTAWC